MIKINKCIKVVIKNCNELTYKDMNKSLADVRYMTCKASNRAMQMYYKYEYDKAEYKKKYGVYIDEKKEYGMTYRNVVEWEMKSIMTTINSSNISQTNAFVMKKWNTDKKDIMCYRKSVANYRLDMPIYIKGSAYKFHMGEYGYEIICSIWNKSQDIKRLTFTIEKIDSNKKKIIKKIIDGEYKQCAAQICQSKKGKWEMLISFGFEPKVKENNKDKVLGIDMGIVNAITMQVFDNKKEKYEELRETNCTITGEEIIAHRQKQYKRRISLHKNCKIGLIGKSGHGIKTKLKCVKKITKNISDFKNTINHKYSKFIITYAQRYECGIIQMEDLSSFSDSENTFLDNWPYFDLQSKVKYKAEEQGIEFKLINPKCTSIRCNVCGNIDPENRNCLENQVKFECVVCGHKDNADINAAKNIAIIGIEEIIKKFIEKNK